MNKPRILIVDDDASIRKFVRANLDARGYEVLLAEDGEIAIGLIGKKPIDVVILDIMMPKMDGFEVCRCIRERSNVPIIMLSAKDGENDKLRCLELGADDYLTKPFSLNELLTRLKVLLRRSRISGTAVSRKNFCYRDLEIDYDRCMVHFQGEEINLTATEYKILTYLALNAGRVITPEFILENVWGQQYIHKPRVLWVNISRLRSKLMTGKGKYDYIKTKPGLGYIIPEKS